MLAKISSAVHLFKFRTPERDSRSGVLIPDSKEYLVLADELERPPRDFPSSDAIHSRDIVDQAM